MHLVPVVRLTLVALSAAPLLAGCAGAGPARSASGAGGPSPATSVTPTDNGAVVWRSPCNSYDSFGARQSVDQCGAGSGGVIRPPGR
jgi:hypothetical protein